METKACNCGMGKKCKYHPETVANMEGLKVKYTPIPWEVRGSAIIGDGYELADCGCSFKPMTENVANAQLIVKAVNCHAELLEACKEAKAIILAECNSGAAGSVHGFLELVIAKAEGRS